MNVIIIAALFLSFAIGVNWMVSDKEKSDMKKELVQTQVVKKDMEKGILDAKGRLGQKTKELEELEAKYKTEVEEKKRLEETLLKAEEARFIAEKKAESDIAALKQQEREKQGVQDKSSELEASLLAMEEARENAEKEARKRAEEVWLQAETARAKAEEVLAKKEEAESRLKTEEEVRQRTEADLKAKTDEIIKLENEVETAKKATEKIAEDTVAHAQTASKQAAASFIEAEKPAEDNKSGQGATTVELKSGEEWRKEIVIKYTVLKGDTLWKIAGKEFIYNAPKLWVVIYKYNLDKLKNPNSLYPGQVLLIPKMVSSEDAKDSFLKAKSALEEAQ